jgi:hypothetical protein
MFLNIITPCSRPQNLLTISRSINIPRENYRWIVVFDGDEVPDEYIIPENCEIYAHKDPESISGNAQRNFAIDMVNEDYVYFNDDDTVIHPLLWGNISNLEEDFISFDQETQNRALRLKGDNIALHRVDSHNFITSRQLIGNTRFDLKKYDADGYFAIECFDKAKTKSYIPKVLSTYNSLRWYP